MDEIKNALNVIKKECEKHESCKTCPMCIVDGFYGIPCCSVTIEGDVPEDWNVEDMVR